MFAHHDAVWCEEDLFGDEKCVILEFGVFNPENIPKIWSHWAITSQNKMSSNSKTVRDTRNVSIKLDNETGIALSDSVNKTCVKRPLAEKSP